MTISCHKGQLLKITLNLLLILIFGLGLSLGAIGQAVAKTQTASPVKSEPTLQITPTRHTTVAPPATSLTTTRSTTEIAGTTAQPTEEAALRATELLGYPAENPQGETLGEIEDVMLGLESEQISYVVLSFGGFLDLGDKLVAVPIDLVRLDTEQGRLILDVSEEQLTNAPAFDSDAWPNASYSDWDLEEQEYWSGQTEMEPDEPAIRATEFLDFQVVNARLETLGEIEDLMIGLDSGRVNYAVLSFGGFLDIGDKLFAVPLSAFALNPQRAALIFDVDRETLENAPGFEPDNWPDTANQRWDVDSSDYWQTPGRFTPSGPNAIVSGTPATVDASAIRASFLLDYSLANSEGETIGQLEDLMIGVANGQISFAVLSLAEAENRLYMAPYTTLRPQPETETFTFSLADEGIPEDMPSFSPDNWPDTTNPLWAQEIASYWTNPFATQAPAVRASRLISATVENLAGEEIGRIEDLLVGRNNVQVTYAVLSLNEEISPRDALYPIPITLLGLDPEREVAITDLNRSVLENAPTFNSDRWPDTTSPNWDIFYRNYWFTVGTTPTATTTGQLFINESDLRAEELLGYAVQNTNQEDLGTIEDLMIGLDSGRVKYAVLAFNGFLDLGEKLFAVPLEQLEIEPVRAIVLLDVTPETLESAPGFEPGNWPDTANPEWDEAQQAFWMADEAQEQPESPLHETTIRMTDMLSYGVVNARLEGLGEIEDVVIGLDSSRVKYAALSFGGFLDIGDKLFAVPLSGLELDPLREVIVFDVTEQTLENAPGFEPDNWPDTANPRWDVDSSTYWQRQSVTGALLPSTTTSMTAQAVAETAARASVLLTSDIFNEQGEKIGVVEELTVGIVSGQVDFVVASLAELGLGDQLYPIPATVIGYDPDLTGFVFTPAETGMLVDAPGFFADGWPDLTETGWAAPFRTYWGAMAVAEEPAVKASELLTYSATGRQQEQEGEVEDLMIGLIQERVNYAILSLPGDDQLTPVPYTLVSLDSSAGELVVNTGQGLLENAPGFNAESWPDTSTPLWDTVYRNYWSGIAIPPPPP